MYLEKLLEVISVQRHDYLNHMQVISGLLQLNKGDRVREYIQKVCLEQKKQSQLSRLSMPCMSAVLLVGMMVGSSHQVEVDFDISSDLKGCKVPPEALCSALETTLYSIFTLLEDTPLEQRKVDIAISEGDEKFIINTSIQDPGALARGGSRILEKVDEVIKPFGARAELTISDQWGDLILTLPKSSDIAGAVKKK